MTTGVRVVFFKGDQRIEPARFQNRREQNGRVETGHSAIPDDPVGKPDRLTRFGIVEIRGHVLKTAFRDGPVDGADRFKSPGAVGASIPFHRAVAGV